MKRGRKTRVDRPVHWKVSIPFSVTSRVDLVLLDTTTAKPEYGKRSELITALLTRWLEDQGIKIDK